jgi:hypothetical protein
VTLEGIVDAGPVDVAERLCRLGNACTAGPPTDLAATLEPHPHPAAAEWIDGWWLRARRLPAHPGRVGGPIRPFGAVVHTTDMLPDEWDALVAAWLGRAGDGACAHFLIGRGLEHGTLQLAPITKNGNHAGGPPGHGVYRVPGVGDVHPNLAAVGIELHCAGGVRRVGGAWRLVEGGVAHGAPLPESEVIPDPARPGRGWHRVTDYQRAQLVALRADLELVLAPVPPGTVKVAFHEVPPAYAVLPGARLATHAELDPQHRADPWPPLCTWLRSEKKL